MHEFLKSRHLDDIVIGNVTWEDFLQEAVKGSESDQLVNFLYQVGTVYQDKGVPLFFFADLLRLTVNEAQLSCKCLIIILLMELNNESVYFDSNMHARAGWLVCIMQVASFVLHAHVIYVSKANYD